VSAARIDAATARAADAATVHAAFAATAAARPTAPFLRVLDSVAARYGVPAGDLSYGEAAARVERLRAALAAAGYGHGHRVALLLENRPAFFLAWLALNALGCSVVPINADLRAAELEYLFGHAEPELAVSIESHAPRLREAAAASGSGTPVVAAAALELVALGAPVLQPLPPARRRAPRAGAPDPDTECGLLYTSGTTGRPKGCVLGQRLLPARRPLVRRASAAWPRCAPGEDVLVTPLPMVHMNAMAYSTMAMVLTGGCIVPLDRFHPSRWWSDVRAARATVVHYLGRDAGDADGRRALARRPRARGALRIRRRGRPAPARRVRGALRLSRCSRPGR
jgi:acyl-CoA synthetase (AMP-forming)/AMP-acid ligase II